MLYFKQLALIVLLPLVVLSSCDKIPSADEDTITQVTNKSGDTIIDPVKGKLLFHENFQKWQRVGYFLPVKQDCDNDLMKSIRVMSYFSSNIQVIYDSFTANYALIDFAVNPECGNKAGTSDSTSNVSLGYVALQCPIYLTCDHYPQGSIQTDALSSVSYVEFSVSYGDNSTNSYANGVSLWKKAKDDTELVKVGTYTPQDPSIGQKFTVKIDGENVIVCLKAEKNPNVDLVNEIDDPLINRSVRIHDLYVWQPNNN